MAEVKIDQPWLKEPQLQTLLALLSEGGEEARVNGGAVRNALMGQPVSDVDISTTLVPRDVILRLKAAGYKAVPTGIEHGTITAVLEGQAFEVTTLRQDIETDGRHAKVLYGKDWEADARRRDLTINALYVDASGAVFDPLSGYLDIESQTVRFIDDAEKRIREDYLRILRFFRFFAWYGKFRPDAEGLKACARLKEGLADLSAERVWQELSKLLAAPDPSRAILWMRQTGVLSAILPESEKWGTDNLPGLIACEQREGWEPDVLVRLMSIIPPMQDRIDTLAVRMKLANKVRNRLIRWAATPMPDLNLKKAEFEKFLYRQDADAVRDHLKLAVAKYGGNPDQGREAKKAAKLFKAVKKWQRPVFPAKGGDLLEQGMLPGPAISLKLKELEDQWINSEFKLSRERLLGLE